MDRIVKIAEIGTLKKTSNPVIIYSLTEESEAIANSCRDHGVNVVAFCDNEIRKSKNLYAGLEVIYTPDLPKRFPEADFLIAHHALDDCGEQLLDMGYKNIYSPINFLKEYNVNNHTHRTTQSYMKAKVDHSIKLNELYFDETKTYLRSIDIQITEKCSMNCESCCNLMQYYERAKNTDEEILRATEILSNNVDYIAEYRIIGGEPLMNKQWAQITNGLAERYPGSIIYIYTNGTICPKDEVLETLKGKNIHFYITDYDELSRNIEKLIESLKKHKLAFYRKSAGNWVDCSQVKKQNRSVPRLKQVFKECCAKRLYSLLNGKLYTCPFLANAANLKSIPDNKADYVDLFSDDKNLKNKIKRLVKMENFFPGCDFCSGRPHDPSAALEYSGKGLIKAGKQMPSMSSRIPFKSYN